MSASKWRRSSIAPTTIINGATLTKTYKKSRPKIPSTSI